VRQTTTAYGPGALTKLEKLCDATNLIPDSRVKELIEDVIQPPVFDREGLVMQPGSIDTAKLEFSLLQAKYLPVLPAFATQ
jgi:hypothetical protein